MHVADAAARWCGVRRLSARNAVPILVRADGEVIAGSGEIKRWAAARAAGEPAAGGAPAPLSF